MCPKHFSISKYEKFPYQGQKTIFPSQGQKVKFPSQGQKTFYPRDQKFSVPRNGKNSLPRNRKFSVPRIENCQENILVYLSSYHILKVEEH